jgi:hypothetical protein
MDARGSRLLQDEGYTALPRIYRNRPGYVAEFYNENVLFDPPVNGTTEGKRHRWLYIDQQMPEEGFALKIYDSDALQMGGGNVQMMCPHSAFRLAGTDERPTRRSLELRVWCIW